MNFVNAVGQLKNGQATKPSSWGGYIKRADDATIENFNTTKEYTTGGGAVVVVRYQNNLYRLTDASAGPGEFEPQAWEKVCDVPHKLVFQERGTENNYWFSSEADVSGSTVRYGDLLLGGQEGSAMMFDGELLTSILVDTSWMIGDAADFEASRTDTTGRW